MQKRRGIAMLPAFFCAKMELRWQEGAVFLYESDTLW